MQDEKKSDEAKGHPFHAKAQVLYLQSYDFCDNCASAAVTATDICSVVSREHC